MTHSTVKCQRWAGRRVNGREGDINIYESHFLLHEEQFSIFLRLAIKAMTLLSKVGEGPKIFSWPTLFMKSLLLKSLTHHECICNSNSQTFTEFTEQQQGELPEPHIPSWRWTNSTQSSHSRPSKQCSVSSLSDATLFFRIFVLCVVTLPSKCPQKFCSSAVYWS